MSDEQTAQKLISIFLCRKDCDVENFLKERSITFEKLGKSRTFFIYDEDREDLRILAYFTLAIQVLKVPESFSNRKIKNFDGFSSKIGGNKITQFPAILIGQVGKSDLYKEEISGFTILQYCLSTILDGQTLLDGRLIKLECKNIPYLISLYEQFGFTKLEKPYEKDELLQFIRILREDDLISKN